MSNDAVQTSPKKRFPAILAAILTIIFFGLAVRRLALTDSSFLTSLEWRWVDLKFRVRGARAPGKEVVIVGLDDKTLEKLGSARVFRRENFAKLIEKLTQADPKAIGFDILFPEKEDITNSTNDLKFAQAIEASQRVVLGVWLNLESRMGAKRTQETLDPEMQQLVENNQVFAAEHFPASGTPPTEYFLGADRKNNIRELTLAARAFGFVNFHPDVDGRLRYQPQVIEYGNRLYPSLDLQLLRQYQTTSTQPTLSPMVEYGPDGKVQSVVDGNYRIPTDQFGRFLLDYAGPHGTFPTVSMIDVMEGRINREDFKDKIVLIGAPAIGLNDVLASPFDPVLPGVELHANVIDNVLHERFLFRRAGLPFGREGLLDLAIILFFGIAIGYILPKLEAAESVVFTIILLTGFLAFNYFAFAKLHWVLSFVYPGLSLVVTSSSLISYKYVTEEREKKRTRQTFQHYLDPLVIEQLLSQPERLRLGGEKRELSVLFSDIRGFTSFSEKMAATEVVQFLNQYFEKMHEIIWRNKGLLDKFIGDAVMCFWGAPLETKDHAVRSVITALEMIQAVEDLRGVLVLPGGAKFDIGIGVNTGEMVYGNMGSPNLFSYTVMGDNVNLGSRLESLNKYYGTKIIISDSTYAEVRELVFCRQLDTIQVKGKSQAVTIYEPMGLRRLDFDRRAGGDRRGVVTLRKRFIRAFVKVRHGERRHEDRRLGSPRLYVKPEHEEIKSMYEHALALYRKGDFDGAQIGFDHVLSLDPGDGPSRLMKERIAKYREEYAGAATRFDPVYKFDEK
jgi:adenylate cyclase